jgi:hypothetical protein
VLREVLASPACRWPEAFPPEHDSPERLLARRLGVFLPLAATDPEWLARNAPVVEQSGRGRWRALLEALWGLVPNELEVMWSSRPHLDLVAVAGVALVESGEADRQALHAWLSQSWVEEKPFAPVIRAALEESTG